MSDTMIIGLDTTIVIGYVVLLAILASAITGTEHVRRGSRGLLAGVIVAAALSAASYSLHKSFSDPVGFLLLSSLALGLFGSFTIVGLPLWLGLRRLGRGRVFVAVAVGVGVSSLGWCGLMFLVGEREIAEIFQHTLKIIVALAIGGGAGSLVAWTVVYGGRISTRAP
jgi:hypothetical protein